jgi:hypothetical protein
MTVITSRALIVGVIVFLLLATLSAALGATVGTREVIVALVSAVIGWVAVKGRHRVIGFFLFAWVTIIVLGLLLLQF